MLAKPTLLLLLYLSVKLSVAFSLHVSHTVNFREHAQLCSILGIGEIVEMWHSPPSPSPALAIHLSPSHVTIYPLMENNKL